MGTQVVPKPNMWKMNAAHNNKTFGEQKLAHQKAFSR